MNTKYLYVVDFGGKTQNDVSIKLNTVESMRVRGGVFDENSEHAYSYC